MIETSEDLRDLYDNAPCGYLTLSPDGLITNVNATLIGWTGHDRASLLGKRFMDLLPVAGRIFYETHFAPLLRMQGQFNEVALDIVTPAGTRLPVLANASERRAEDGSLVYTRLSLFQATQRRRHERALGDANAAATALNQELSAVLAYEKQTAELREQFIAVLGHDLRNPLAGIEGGRRFIQRTCPDDAKVQSVLKLMGESITRMSRLIDDVMDLARSRLGGGIGLDRVADQRIEPTLLQVIDEMQAGHAGRVIQSRLDLTRPVDVDHARIAQMFSNLLGNAINHGAPDQPVIVEAVIADGHFKLAIANGGEPISEAAMERLFQPFYRGHVRPSMQGLGLGLYIAKQIADAHGGCLEVKSDVGETRFTFRMPVT
ncbi:MAG: PAS domain-containing sensor histidine kinase [Pelagibacterium sp. SCN 63-23]|nr:MAG: PAS domain-containing sensor histidine kinase [Pelagibacterium sp. SCN 63-23]